MSEVKKVCIIASKRIPFMRSNSLYTALSNRELMVPALKTLVREVGLEGKEIGEVAMGAVNKHAYDFALARECVMDSGLSPSTPATDVQKACGTSLEATILIANKIALGQIDCGIAGGADTNSDVPIEFKKAFSDRLLALSNAKTFGQKVSALKGFNPKELLPKIPGIKEPERAWVKVVRIWPKRGVLLEKLKISLLMKASKKQLKPMLMVSMMT